MSSPEPARTEARIVELESQLLYLQRDFQSLNEVVLEQRELLEKLQQALLRVEGRITQVEGDEPRDLLAERPPHY